MTPADTPTADHARSSLAAYLATKRELEAIPDDAVVTVSLDPWNTTQIVFAAIPRIRAHRRAISQARPRANTRQIDALERYALTLSYADGQVKAATTVNPVLKMLYTRGRSLRAHLVGDARVLVKRNIINASELDEITNRPGYRSVSCDLTILASVLTRAWPKAEGRTAITADEIAEAASLQQQIAIAAARRADAGKDLRAAMDLRERAFILLVAAYREARRVIRYLREYDGDTDEIVPSLYTGHGPKHAKKAAVAPMVAPATT